MSFKRSKNPYKYVYNINMTPLVEVVEKKDLGVHFTMDLRFNRHIDLIVSKSLKFLGFIIRNSYSFKEKTIIQLYNSFVRQKLEYASIIWNPKMIMHITVIEKVQSKLLKHIIFKRTGYYPTYTNYETLLEIFKLKTLKF